MGPPPPLSPRSVLVLILSLSHRAPADQVFETVAATGFDWVRIPIQWNSHTASTSPYLIDADWLATVNETVGWALKHGLKAMINTHHETWLDNETAFPTMLPRLEAIWEQVIFARCLIFSLFLTVQVAESFASVSDDQLVFELLNEPDNITIAQLNEMNTALLAGHQEGTTIDSLVT